MINKQNLWFLTLFSLILVLSVYYVTMPNDLLLTNNGAVGSKKNEQTSVSKDTNTDTTKKQIFGRSLVWATTHSSLSNLDLAACNCRERICQLEKECAI